AAFFPRYDAIVLHRRDAPARHAKAFAAWRALEGRLDEAAMIRLNARAEIDRIEFGAVAREFLGSADKGSARTLWSSVFGPDFLRLALEHATLVFGSLVAAIAARIPAG